MSWVDSIAGRDTEKPDRTQHFFINAENTPINDFDKKYFANRNISDDESTIIIEDIQEV